MGHAVLVLALLAVTTQIAACAAIGSSDALKGQSGPVAWDVIEIQQSLEGNGYWMRWDFTLFFKNIGATAVDFERVEHGSRAGGPVDDVVGGMSTTPFSQRLEPAGELRVRQSESWGCPQCAPGRLPRFFSDGIIVYYTLFGHDATGGSVRVPIAVRLNSSVGERK